MGTSSRAALFAILPLCLAACGGEEAELGPAQASSPAAETQAVGEQDPRPTIHVVCTVKDSDGGAWYLTDPARAVKVDPDIIGEYPSPLAKDFDAKIRADYSVSPDANSPTCHVASKQKRVQRRLDSYSGLAKEEGLKVVMVAFP